MGISYEPQVSLCCGERSSCVGCCVTWQCPCRCSTVSQLLLTRALYLDSCANSQGWWRVFPSDCVRKKRRGLLSLSESRTVFPWTCYSGLHMACSSVLLLGKPYRPLACPSRSMASTDIPRTVVFFFNKLVILWVFFAVAVQRQKFTVIFFQRLWSRAFVLSSVKAFLATKLKSKS